MAPGGKETERGGDTRREGGGQRVEAVLNRLSNRVNSPSPPLPTPLTTTATATTATTTTTITNTATTYRGTRYPVATALLIEIIDCKSTTESDNCGPHPEGSFRAVSGQFQSSFGAISGQFQGSFRAVSEQL